MSLKTVTFKASISASTYDHYTARVLVAAELRHIADQIEEGSCVGESGTAAVADHLSWEINDPWEGMVSIVERRKKMAPHNPHSIPVSRRNLDCIGGEGGKAATEVIKP
jgi:hypothetical protein